MIAGVGGHLLLHTKWIVAMTKKLLAPGKRTAASASGTRSDTGATSSGRRRFLKLGGAILGVSALAACGAALLGLRTAFGEDEETVRAVGSNASEDAPKFDAPNDVADVGTTAEQPAAVEAEPHDTAPALSDDSDIDAAPATEPISPPTAEPPTEDGQELCVACPRGLVNDPYPGCCRRYVDRDGDGICDLSVPHVCG